MPITKRVFDLILTIPALMILSPLLLILAVLVGTLLGFPILFRQERPGLRGVPFWLLKYRTMINARNASGDLLPDAARLTAFGRVLRTTSLDELPELFNVLKGDMSLVGPRPLLMQYLDRYTPEQARRHEVWPGITGWAQVNGYRGETDELWKMEKRVQYDMEYIENWNFGWDIAIIWETIFGKRSYRNAF